MTNVADDLTCLINAIICYIKSFMSIYIIDFFFFFFYALRSVYTILEYRCKRRNDNNWRLANNTIEICSLGLLFHTIQCFLILSLSNYFLPPLIFIHYIHLIYASIYTHPLVHMRILSLFFLHSIFP